MFTGLLSITFKSLSSLASLAWLFEAFLYLVRNDKSISMKENAEEQEGEGGARMRILRFIVFAPKAKI